MLGALYSGSSMMKKDFLYLCPVICLISKAPKKISAMPVKYISQLTQAAPPKNTPPKSAITGILAPQGIHVVSMAVARLSLSSLIVRQAMMPGMPQPVLMMIGIIDLPERPYSLEDRVHDHTHAGHVATVFEQSDQEVHHHYQRQEADHGANAADDTVSKQSLQEGAGSRSFQRGGYPALEHLYVSYQPVRDQRSQPGLRNVENAEHDGGENHNAGHLVGENLVYSICCRLVLGKNLSGLHLGDNLLTKAKRFLSSSSDGFLVRHVYIRLHIRSFLPFAV